MIDEWLVLTLLVFAVYRIAQLIAFDEISEPIRTYLAKRASGNLVIDWTAKLVHCPYCLGIWLSLLAGLLFANMFEISTPMGVVTVFGIAGAQAFLQSLCDYRDT